MNRQQMKKYKDTNDRILIQKWFSKKGHHLTEGGYYDVDLKGKNFDIEITYQGCSSSGFCYAPVITLFTIDIIHNQAIIKKDKSKFYQGRHPKSLFIEKLCNAFPQFLDRRLGADRFKELPEIRAMNTTP